MNLYVLDTDTLSLFERGHPGVVACVLSVPPSELAVSVVTAEEQMEGRLAQIRQAQGRKNPAQIVQAYDLLATTIEAARHFRILRMTEAAVTRYEALRARKLNVGPKDLRIAAIALEHGAVVVTRNQRDFGRVPDLTTEDWTQNDL